MRTSSPRRAPAWTAAADTLTLLLIALAVAVFVWDPGWRFSALGVRLSLRSGLRILAWAAVVTACRHAVVPRPSLPGRAARWLARLGRHRWRAGPGTDRTARPIAGAAGRAARGLGRATAGAIRRGIESLRRPGREWIAVARDCRWPLAIAASIVVARSLVFVFWEQASFDSDQAVVGLMAKHLAEGRAFPLFYYGQSYMLGVQAWMAAPLFLVTGPTVAALKLPLVAINVAAAVLLIVILRREVGLGGWQALAASSFFVIAPPAAAVRLVEANGGSVEPLFYVLLLWAARRRPAVAGAILAFGFLHREFTAYGAGAIALLWVGSGRAFAVGAWRRAARALAAALVVVALVQAAKVWSAPLGPGTRGGLGEATRTNVGQLSERFCWRPGSFGDRLVDLRNRHLGVLFGTARHPLWKLRINSATTWQGLPGLGLLMVAALAVSLARIGAGRSGRRLRPPPGPLAFPLYLVIVGVSSMAMYWAVSCEPITVETLRYGLLALLAPVGVAAAFLRVEPGWRWKGAVVGALVVWSGLSAASHVRLLEEYVRAPPGSDARAAVDALEAQGVTLARSKHSIAFWFTFLAAERVVLSSDNFPRIAEHQARVEALGPKADFIAESPCPNGVRLAGAFHRCPR